MTIRVGAPIPGGQRIHGARKGPPPGLGVRRGGKRREKKKSNNIRTVVLVVAIAFLFLFTPAQERISNQLEKWLQDFLDEFGPAREYPVHATYTVERHVSLFNPYSDHSISFNYELPIPTMRTDFGNSMEGFESANGATYPVMMLQDVVSMIAHTEGSENYVNIPTEEGILWEDDAIELDSLSEIYWPPVGGNSERCSVQRCAIWQGEILPYQTITLTVQYDVTSSSYSWYSGPLLPDEVPRSPEGFSINSGNAGTYADYDRDGRLDTMYDQFGMHQQWYDRDTGQGRNWAIDGVHPVVTELANEIESGLDSDDNPYEFAHAAFIKIRDTVTYFKGLDTARSGPDCITAKIGDCDEQSNAWMSLLRTRNIPAWYEFGPMADSGFSQWEPHAWANAIFPLSTEFCDIHEIQIESCFVEGEVDVVNNRWLLHTPTTITEWIEQPSNLGEGAYDFYRPLSIGCSECWFESWETIGEPLIEGGYYRVPELVGM